MSGNTIHNYQKDVAILLEQVNPKLPLFIYSHSMGGLTIASLLSNNPHLNIAGVMFSAPFLTFADRCGVNEVKKVLVKILAPHLEEFLLNPGLPIHQVCNDKRYFSSLLTNRKFIPFLSLKLTQSMMEYIDDLPLNCHKFKFPYLMMLAGKEKIISNEGAKIFMANSGSKI